MNLRTLLVLTLALPALLCAEDWKPSRTGLDKPLTPEEIRTARREALEAERAARAATRAAELEAKRAAAAATAALEAQKREALRAAAALQRKVEEMNRPAPSASASGASPASPDQLRRSLQLAELVRQARLSGGEVIYDPATGRYVLRYPSSTGVRLGD